MRKLALSCCLSFCLFAACATPVLAWTGPSGNDPEPVVDESGGGGGYEGGDGDGPAPPPAEPKEPELLTYTPVVTALHSLNALLAEDGDAVYFMPMLEDFPVDLVDTCADITTEDGKEHKFAIVYDGYYNTEVAYNVAQNDNTDTADVSRLQTSKKVYAQTDNSRTLNLLGYDLLLSDERASIVTKGEVIEATYIPTLVGTAPLSAKTVIMDLYKAVGVYEWDVKVAFGIDESLAVNTSPIMQQIAVLTNDEVEGGIEVSEGATYVWATRTNPDIYWTRCKRDAIFDGGAHRYTKDVYIGNEVSVTFSKNELQNVTMLEFCQLARAIMELYGEPVLTEREIEIMIQQYALTLPTSGMSQEGMEAVRYLAAKGIIDPSGVNWSKNVTFADIEEFLLRIADEDSRLTFKNTVNPDSTMAHAGYAKVPLAQSNVMYDNLEEIVNPFDADYYDYYIEAVDGYTNFYLTRLSGVDLREQENMTGDPDHDMPTFGSEAPDNNKLTVIGDSISAYSGYDSGASYYPNHDVYDPSQMWYNLIAKENGYQVTKVAAYAGCLTGDPKGGVTGIEQAASWIDSTAGTTAIFIGTNDVMSKTPVSEFEEAYKQMLSTVRSRNPNTKIVCLTPYQSGCEPYNEAILRACQEYSAGIVNLPTPVTADNTHPLSDGMKTIASASRYSFGGVSPSQGTGNGSDDSTTLNPSPIIQEGKEYAFACDKLVVAGADNVSTTTGSGFFEYCGMDTYKDNYYYHFKISKDIGSVTIKYDYDPALEKLLDITEYTLPDATGGVYNFSAELQPKLTFDEAGFTDQFVDEDRYTNDYNELADTESYLSDWHWYKVEFKSEVWDNMVKGTDKECQVFSVNQVVKGEQTNVLVTAKELEEARNTTSHRYLDDMGNAWYVHESAVNSIDRVILVCQTKLDLTTFTNGVTNMRASLTNNDAYYRAEDGTLLASYDYLRDLKLCNNIQALPSGSGLMLSTKSGNVSLRDDLDLVIVGDTAIPANGEMLYYKDGNTFFINIKACLGWSNDYTVVTTESVLIPLFREKSGTRVVKATSSTKSMASYFPTSAVNIGYQELSVPGQHNGSGKGFSLATTNPLGCYMVVMDFNSDTDYLFVWHRNGVVDKSGNEHTLEDGGARSKFAELTGVNLGSVSSDYTLIMFQLNRNNQSNPAGIKYLYYDYKGSYSEGTGTFGYVYEPPAFDDIDAALSAYISGDSSCCLPIATINGRYKNLNINTCTDMEGNKQLPIGTLPLCMSSSSSKAAGKMGALQGNGGTVKETSATYDNLESVKIYPAPVGLFQTLKGLGSRPLSQWTKGSGGIFFGSSACAIKNGKITVNNNPLDFDTNVDALCVLLNSSAKSVFVINEDSSALGSQLSEELEEMAVIITDPETLVDWSQYQFKRLVENMDSWTTILLIFVLNVLPRIGMLLFFCLMLLSLIKDVKFWRAFCVNHFDVYSFLTMGKQNVDTVDMKKIMFISLICFSIFLVIMDGQLFNFIIFICRFIITITQR